jgi:hypothetical protein
MRKHFLTQVLLNACAAALLAPKACPDTAAEVRRMIQANYNREAAAFMRKDATGLLANYAPDYVATQKSGKKLTLDDIRPVLPDMFAAMSDIKDARAIKKFVFKDSHAIVTVTDRAESKLKNPKTRKNVRLVMVETRRDVWVKLGANWKIKTSRTLSKKQTVNGKPLRG